MRKFWISLIIIGSVLAVYAQTNETVETDTEQELLDRIELDPSDYQAYIDLMDLYESKGEYSERIEIAYLYLQNIATTADAYQIIGDSYRSSGDYNKALDAYQLAVQLDPDGAKLYNRLGLVLLSLKNYHEAESAFKAAVFFNGTGNAYARSIYLNNLGVAFEAREEYTEAKTYFEEAVQYNSKYQKAVDNLQRVMSNLNMFD